MPYTPPPAALGQVVVMIMHFEGFRSRPYWDAEGHCWSIGYGFCTLGDGTVVTGATPPLSLVECQDLLQRKLATEYMPAVLQRCAGITLTTGQLAALTSFAWNLGPGRIVTAGLPKLLARGDFKGAAAVMRQYTRAKSGVELPGLVTRRVEEGAVLCGASWPLVAQHPVPAARVAAGGGTALVVGQPEADELMRWFNPGVVWGYRSRSA